jgi:hypothetical protein
MSCILPVLNYIPPVRIVLLSFIDVDELPINEKVALGEILHYHR